MLRDLLQRGSLGRIVLVALFLWSGHTELAHMAPNAEYMKAYDMPAPELLIWPAALLERTERSPHKLRRPGKRRNG